MLRVEGSGVGSDLIEFWEMPEFLWLMHVLMDNFIADGDVFARDLININSYNCRQQQKLTLMEILISSSLLQVEQKALDH